MAIKVGDQLPDVELVKVTSEGAEKIQAKDFFSGRKVVLFAVPGAFTPTCSARHLPGFVELADEIKAKGVDEIAAIAVNDQFVMAAWSTHGGADGKVTMLADGNAAFARAAGLDVDASAFGMAVRSQRYAMVVNDGRVEQLEIEQPGAFEVSSAEAVLAKL